MHVCRYLALCFCLPTWTERILFFVISHACFGIINLQVRRHLLTCLILQRRGHMHSIF